MATQTITQVSPSDLTLRVDDRVATYTMDGVTYTVFASYHGWTVQELIESVRNRGVDSDLDAWIQGRAYDAGIRVSLY